MSTEHQKQPTQTPDGLALHHIPLVYNLLVTSLHHIPLVYNLLVYNHFTYLVSHTSTTKEGGQNVENILYDERLIKPEKPFMLLESLVTTTRFLIKYHYYLIIMYCDANKLLLSRV